MSVERINREITFTCDSCPEELETGYEGFTDALQSLRQSNWTARQVRGEWVHTCAACNDPVSGFRDLGD